MESVMILGAGPLQVPAIKKAKEYGMYVYACDYDENAVGFSLADEALLVSTIDKEKILEVAKQKNPDYIITSTSDAPVRTVAYVCEKLGMSLDLAYEDAICATDKSAMRDRLARYSVPIPLYFYCDCFEEVKNVIKKFDNRCIIKPADSAASRGVELIYTSIGQQELLKHYEYAKSYSRTGRVMVEEFMEGPEVSVECIILNKDVHILAITDKLVCELPYFVEIGHMEQSMLPESTKTKIRDITREAIHAIGIVNGCSHVELKITESGPKIVEIAARLGGDYITSRLVPLSTGVDMVGASLAIALKKDVDITIKQNRGSAIRFLFGKKGIIKEIHIDSSIYDMEGIEEVEIYCKVGEQANELHSSNDRLGHIIASGETAKHANGIVEAALKKIEIEII